jgi:hypothetical protein
LILGILAAVVGTAASIPYILSIRAGKTKPDKTSWLIWTAVGLLMFASYWSVGARDTVWITLPVGIAAIAAFSLKYGVGGWSVFDRACALAAFAGLLLWWLSGLAITALALAMVADIIGYFPTIKKTWDKPNSEDRLTWGMYLLAAVFNFLAINSWTPEIAIYPTYILVFNALVFWLAVRKSR